MSRRRRILAVASGGGHWIQLQRLRPAWDGMDVTYVSTKPGAHLVLAKDAKARGQPEPRFIVIPDANRWQKLRLLWLLAKLALILLRYRPDVIVTTGAAPGYFALRLGRLMGARTIWIDSIANAAEMSLSGRLAKPYADLWMTQWPEVAEIDGARFEGAVL